MINEKDLQKEIADFKRATQNFSNADYITGYISALSAVEGMIALLEMNGCWNKITIHEDEEECYFTNLPEDGQRVLTAWKGYVREDEFIDGGMDGVYFDSGNDVEDGMYWMPLPEPPHEEEGAE